MCRLLGIQKTRTTPQSDGMVEWTLEAQLAKFVRKYQRDWDNHLEIVHDYARWYLKLTSVR